MERTRILVCGGRDFEDGFELWGKLSQICEERNINKPLIIEGGAKGADQWGAQWALMNKYPLETYKADWDKHGKKAGPIRNQQMLDEGKPDLVVAFPTKTSRGTWHMIKIAKEAGVETIVIGP